MKQNQMEYKPKRIDDKEAIKWIEYRLMEGRLNGSDKEPVIDEPYQAGMIAINAIYKKPRWTLVKDGLPKEDELVLISIADDTGDNIHRYTTCAWYYNGIWVVDNERIPSSIVEAWMPLPEPYKEIRNEA